MTSPATGSGRPLWELPQVSPPEVGHPHTSPHTVHGAKGGHQWMMLICCVPMVATVVLLIVSGTAGSGALLFALVCVAVMAAMMFTMSGGHSRRAGHGPNERGQ